HVFFERLVAAVNHHAGEPFIDAILAQLECIAVIEMDGNRDIREADGGFDELLEINRVGVLACAPRNLQHDRGLFLLASLDDRLEQFHVVYIEGAERVFSPESLGEKVLGMSQWHSIRGSVLNILRSK